MLSRHLRLAAASALRAESSSSSSSSGGGLLAQSSSQLASSPFFSAAVRAISSVAASPSRAALLAAAAAPSARSASGHAASCSYSTSVQSKLPGASSQRGFAADAALAAIDESDGDEEKGSSPPVAVKTLPDVPPGSR